MKKLRRIFFLAAAGLMIGAPLLMREPAELPTAFYPKPTRVTATITAGQGKDYFNSRAVAKTCDQACVKNVIKIINTLDDYNSILHDDEKRKNGSIFDKKHITSKSSYIGLRAAAQERAPWFSPAPPRPEAPA